MELAELRGFLAVAETLHFGAAAGRLGISQPALSKQIRRLESRLGGPVLIRHSRGVRLTPAGELLRSHAPRLLADWDRAATLARLAIAGEAGELRIGAGIAALAGGLPAVLAQFRQAHPGVHVTVRDMASLEQAEALRRRDIDVGFLRMPVEAAADFAVEPLLEDSLQAVVPSAHRPFRGLRALAEEPFLVLSRAASATYHDHVLATCRAAGFTPRIGQEANQLYTVLNLVRAGLGVTLAPASARSMRIDGVRFAATGIPAAAWRIAMVSRHDPDPAVSRFLRMARQHLGAHR